jgi:eukaryotic-like serine/threonine-protein kinase
MVTDFGIARIAADVDEDTHIMGTAHFMSPEQAMGLAIDGRSDIYALGIVGFISASGRLPFPDGSLLEYAAARANDPPPPIGTIAGGVPQSVCAVIDRCLERQPSNRFPTAEEIATVLDAATAPAKARLPVALRVWASTETPLLSMYQISSVISGVVAMVEGYLRGTGHLPFLNLPFLFAWTLAPIIPIAAFQIRKTRNALAAGYNISDLRLALRTWVAERREELAFQSSGTEPAWAQLVRWAFAGSVTLSFVFVFGLFMTGGLFPGAPKRFESASEVIGLGNGLFCTACFLIMAGAGIPLEPPKARQKSIGRMARFLWNGRFGAWLARILTPRNVAVPEAHFRPTELALGVAVDELFAALPTAYRQHVGDLPMIGNKLMAEAAWLRSEVERLQELRTHARGEETQMIDPMLAGARSQLGRTVGALEQMRLELMRLHGGAKDMRPLTTSLDAAREMVADVVRLRQAETEIEPRRRLLPIDARTPSPA